ncbi:MAG: hypothetical protein ACTSRH_08610 [Promethearchaeota archaeon]
MPTLDKKAENMKIASVTNLINNAFNDYNKNVKENETLSLLLGSIIEDLERGHFPSKLATVYMLSKSMETTKSDPQAISDYDPLLEIAQLIVRTDKLPTKDTELQSVLLKEFQEEYLASSRRHNTTRDNDKRTYTMKIFSSYGFIDPTLIYPDYETSSQNRKQKKKLTFKKAPGG